MNYGPYACRECQGFGEMECNCCGQETACDNCDGDHYDPDLIDMPAYRKACNAMRSEKGRGTWAVVENGVYVGRTNGVDKVLVADFAIREANL